MSRAQIPTQDMYWLADAVGMTLGQGPSGVSGDGKMRVPLVPGLNLSCPLKVAESMYRSKTKEAAILVHIRWDLYLMVGQFEDGDGVAIAIDSANSKTKMADLFKSATGMKTVITRLSEGLKTIAGVWYCEKDGEWREVSADSVGESIS